MARMINAANIRNTAAVAWQNVSQRSNCSGFLRDVARQFDIMGLESVANSQIEFIATNWELIPTAAIAVEAAGQGFFVVAVLRGWEHADHRPEGHVAIVLPGPLQRRGVGVMGGAYPLVWCAGGRHGQSDGTRTVGDVWRDVDRNHVHYYRFRQHAN